MISVIGLPILILLGDYDFVRLEHAVETFRLIPNAELAAVIPSASHFVLFSEQEMVIPIVRYFLEKPGRAFGWQLLKVAITPVKPDNAPMERSWRRQLLEMPRR